MGSVDIKIIHERFRCVGKEGVYRFFLFIWMLIIAKKKEVLGTDNYRAKMYSVIYFLQHITYISTENETAELDKFSINYWLK